MSCKSKVKSQRSKSKILIFGRSKSQEVLPMASEAQILANRRNAQKSTGPNRKKVLEIRSITLFLCASVPLWL